jgi:hypothetical protein
MDILRAGAGGAGFGAASRLTGKLSLGKRILAGAGGQAVPPLAIDIMDDRPGNAVLLELGTNLAFGGLFNAIPPTSIRKDQLRSAEAMHRVGMRMIDASKGKPVEYSASLPALQAVIGIENGPTPAPDLTAYLPTDPTPRTTPTKTLGAATATDTAQPGLDKPTDPLDLDLSELATMRNTTPKASFSKKFTFLGHDWGTLRWDMAGMVGGSEIPDFRAAARAVGLDWIPDETGAPVTYSASEWVTDRYKATVAELHLTADQAYAQHREAAKKGGRPALSRDEFNVEVGKALRRGGASGDPNVESTAKAFRATLDRLNDMAKRHGVDIGYVTNYVPRKWNAGAIDAIITDLGAKLAPDRDLATQFAIGKQAVSDMIDRSVNPSPGPAGSRGKGTGSAGESVIQKGGRASTEDITANRIDLDETYREAITLPDGSTYDIGIEDLIESDAAVLLASYAHQIHGKMAISRLAQVFGTQMDGSKEVVEGISGIVKSLERTARDSGLPEVKWRDDLTKIETMLKLTAGVPTYKMDMVTRTFDGLRRIANMRSMANVGTSVNNSIELVQASAELGGEFVSQRIVPAMKEVISIAREGKYTSELARDLAQLGIGIDRAASRILPRLGDDLANPVGKTKFEILLAKGERLAFDVSLQSFATDAARFTAGMAYMDKWASLAHAGQMFSEKRLALQGLSTSDARAIAEEIKKHAVWANKPGGTLRHMGFENWDPHLRRQFSQAASRTVRRLVLENNPTSYAQWMTRPVGKVLAQFRTFSFVSHSAKFLAEFRTRDITTSYVIAATTVGAASLYVARTLMDAAVQKDKKEFLEDRLDAKKIMLAAYSRSSYSALFPTFVDTLISDFGRQDPLFSFARTTGLRGGGLIGNPTVDYLKEIGFNPLDFDPLKVPRAIVGPLSPDYRFSQQDWRALKAGLAIPDILNLRKLADQYARELPPTSTD